MFYRHLAFELLHSFDIWTLNFDIDRSRLKLKFVSYFDIRI